MFCTKCGANVPDGSTKCPSCGTQLQPLSSQTTSSPEAGGPTIQPPPKPNNNLVWAILTTLLCCLPAGIVSIVYAAQVDGKYFRGDYAGAANSSRQAGIWSIVSAAAGVVAIVICIIAMAAGLMSSRGATP